MLSAYVIFFGMHVLEGQYRAERFTCWRLTNSFSRAYACMLYIFVFV